MSVIDITSTEQFEELSKASGVHIVKVSTTTCGPCKMMAPLFEKLSNDFSDTSFYSLVPSDEEGTLTLARKLNVSSVPAYLIYKDNELINQFSGAFPLSVLQSRLGL